MIVNVVATCFYIFRCNHTAEPVSEIIVNVIASSFISQTGLLFVIMNGKKIIIMSNNNLLYF